MDFGNFAENWKNRPKIIFSHFLQLFKGKKLTLEILLKIENIAQKSFFRSFCSFSEGKNRLWKFCWKSKKSPKNNFFALSAALLKGENELWKFFRKLKKTPKNHFSRTFCSFSERKKWTLEILLKIDKIALKSFFSHFLQIFWKEKMDLGNFAENLKNSSKIIFWLSQLFYYGIAN